MIVSVPLFFLLREDWRMRLDVLGLARALGAVAPAAAAPAGSIDDDAEKSNAIDDDAFASAWLQSGAVLALHPSR